jgi:hypothetical protein
MTDQDDVHARTEAVERLQQVCKTNTETIETLRGRGASLDTHLMLRERTELLYDLLFGRFDPNDLDACSPERIGVETAWAERLRKMLSLALVETSASPELLVPKKNGGLHLPPNRKENR